eukprot:SAG31_NODE_5566_length_2453_cov_9.443500_1_plen_46_part_10
MCFALQDRGGGGGGGGVVGCFFFFESKGVPIFLHPSFFFFHLLTLR